MKVHPPYHSSFICNRILVTLMMMTIENGEAFKAKRFDSRNLVIFMVTAFGWTWLFKAFIVLEALQMPTGVGTSNTNIAAILSVIGILLVMPFGPIIGGFILTRMSMGREGVSALWKRF
jgi:hypothetical protein